MTRYLVKLKPIDNFFFGSERTFIFKEDGKLQNNIIKSTFFPQQTSILGMLRKEILVKKGLLNHTWDYVNKEEKINKYIGRESFNINEETQDFGCIERISPVFIESTEINGQAEYIMKIPKDHTINREELNDKKEKVKNSSYVPLKINEINSFRCSYGGREERNIYLPVNFIGKDGICNDFIHINDKNDIVEKDEIFIEDSNIGIQLDKNHITKDDSLFRIVKYKFSNKKYEKIEFVFLADINEKIDFDNYKNVVSLGGEGSYFNIKFEKYEVNSEKDNLINQIKDKCKIEDSKSNENIYKKIVLLSDTYIDENEYEYLCEYSIANIISFRNLNTKREYKGKKYYKRFDKSEQKYSFLERGSVLYTTNEKYEELKKAIEKNNLQKIGYNIFV